MELLLQQTSLCGTTGQVFTGPKLLSDFGQITTVYLVPLGGLRGSMNGGDNTSVPEAGGRMRGGPRRCRSCGDFGHNSRTCSVNRQRESAREAAEAERQEGQRRREALQALRRQQREEAARGAREQRQQRAEEVQRRSYRDWNGLPDAEELNANFEQSPHIALGMFHVNCNLWQYSQPISDMEMLTLDENDLPSPVASLVTEISDNLSTTELQKKLLTSAQTRTDPLQAVRACGACGIRALGGLHQYEAGFHRVDLNQCRRGDAGELFLSPLQLSPEAVQEYHGRGEHSNVASVTRVNIEGQEIYFYLHPELVSDGATWLCDKCFQHVKNNTENKPPPFSIAAGMDYGLFSRLGLPRLSMAEWCLISPIRLYSHAIVLSAGTTNQPRKLTGHVVAFTHSAVTEAVQYLNTLPSPDSFHDVCRVYFLGTRTQWQQSQRALRSGTTLCEDLIVNPVSIFKWLRVLQRIHPAYNAVEIVENHDMAQRLLGLFNEAIEHAVVGTEELSATPGGHFWTNEVDVAGVRSVPTSSTGTDGT